MSALRELKSRILVEGEDLRIDEADVALIRSALPPLGPLAADDLKVLLEMRSEARSVCPAFDDFFFPVFKSALLADGKITPDEQFYLLRMLYGGGGIDENERRFLQELRRDLKHVSPEFDALCRQALRD